MVDWKTAVVILLAVLVGAALPMLYQLGGALRSARRLMEGSGKELEQALRALSETLVRVDRLLGTVEDGTAKLASTLGAVVAPAVGAAIRAWREPAAVPEGAPRAKEEVKP